MLHVNLCALHLAVGITAIIFMLLLTLMAARGCKLGGGLGAHVANRIYRPVSARLFSWSERARRDRSLLIRRQLHPLKWSLADQSWAPLLVDTRGHGSSEWQIGFTAACVPTADRASGRSPFQSAFCWRDKGAWGNEGCRRRRLEVRSRGR